jgi:3-dehydroquinate synthetase
MPQKAVKIKSDFVSQRTAALVCGRNTGSLPDLAPEIFRTADKFCLVTDRRCLAVFKPRFRKMMGRFAKNMFVFAVPEGESAKTLEVLGGLLAFMLKTGCSRRSVLIAAGGGSVTDLAGLAAALYMRGIDWISVPTTLLGQIDAGIGGKTAVNIDGVKNAAGSFHQPALAVCDAVFLDTLSIKELKAGAGELIKYALIAPGKLGAVISNNLPGALEGEKENLAAVASACAAFKFSIVSRDEREKTGLRETLNFGHTAGHAFETLAKGRLSHGESVLWGLRYAAALSISAGILGSTARRAIEGIFRMAAPPVLPPVCRVFAGFRGLIGKDKKKKSGANRFILISGPGRLKAVNDIPDRLLKRTLKEL